MKIVFSYQFKKHTFKKVKSYHYTHEKLFIIGKDNAKFTYYTRLIDWLMITSK